MTRKQRTNLVRIITAFVLTVLIVIFFRDKAYSLFLYIIPAVIVGYDVALSAVSGIFRGRLLDEKFLMTVATVGAFAVGEYIEAVAVMLLFQVGELFEGIAVGKSRKSIAELMNIRPDRAVVLRDGEEVTLTPQEVKAGEIILIKPGDRIPLDGVIIEGSTTVDASSLTGESVPAVLNKGDRVISGTVNLSSVVKAEVECEYDKSTASRVLELIEDASAKKTRSESFITKFSRVYTPCVVIAALLLSVIPPLLFSGDFKEWIYRGLVFLAVSCPCALIISVPLTFFGGIGRASKRGILIKNAGCIETLSKTKTAVFDKTGTLTEGKFSVTGVYPVNTSKEELLRLALICERGSNHPIAHSIVMYAGENSEDSSVSAFTEYAGKGTEIMLGSSKIRCGNADFIDAVCKVPDEYRTMAGTSVHIASESEYMGCITLADKVREDAKEAIESLKSMGVKTTVMLTGDSQERAESVGKELRVDRIKARLLPADKVDAVEELIGEGSPVVFAGDGINDAPVISRSDVGIAMGAMGNDAAMEAADVVLLEDKLTKFPEAVKISKKTMRIVKENIIFSLGVKGVVLVLGACGIAGMWLAIFADVGVLVLAILNAMRILISK
ncbi:MAG: heavy metal translocating P-type ATPase [Ruminococcus sp.]